MEQNKNQHNTKNNYQKKNNPSKRNNYNKKNNSSKRDNYYKKSNYKAIEASEKQRRAEEEKKANYEMQRQILKYVSKKLNNNSSKLRTSGRGAQDRFKTYTKEIFRTYISNPINNANELRKMSTFLSKICLPYERLIRYYTSIPKFRYVVTPIIPTDDTRAPEEILGEYQEATKLLEELHLPHELPKVVYTAIQEGCFYGYVIEKDGRYFIIQFPSEFCRIYGIQDGCYNFQLNFEYYKGKEDILETLDEDLKALYNEYLKDTTNGKWQEVNCEKSICIPYRQDNRTLEMLPALLGMFESVIDAVDMRSLQKNRNIIDNYKLILLKIPFISNTKDTDDFMLEIDTVMDQYAKLQEIVPSDVGIGVTSMDTDVIEFNKNKTADEISLASKSINAIFDESGTSQMLFNSSKSGSVGINSSIKTDEAFVWETVVVIERWVNRFLSYKFPSSNYIFQFLNITIFNENEMIDRELKAANSGVPNKLRLAASLGIPLQGLDSVTRFENEILKINEKWQPLKTSYTLSGSDEPGRPETPDSELTDEGAKNKDGNASEES